MSRVLLILICIVSLGGCGVGSVLNAEHGGAEVWYEFADVGLPYAAEGNVVIQASNEETVTEEVTAGGDSPSQMIDAQLLAKYPDTNDWMANCDYGDIPYLANAAYIDKSLEEGIFKVSTPEELASFNYYVNAVSEDGSYQYMQLMNDIDLEGYEWAPMGWSGGTDTGVAFSGAIWGEGFTIRNLYIDNDEHSVGFIGWGTYYGAFRITLENAYVKGNSDVGILTGQSIQGWCEDCHVTGEVYGNDGGSLHGYSAGEDIYDCTADVIVNGEVFPFLSWNEKERSEIVIENPLTVVLHDDYSVSYTPGQQFTNLGWQVKKDGKIVVERESPYETFSYKDQTPGSYSICLTAFVEGQYVSVSNVVEYTIE